jgi:hypothetical protein
MPRVHLGLTRQGVRSGAGKSLVNMVRNSNSLPPRRRQEVLREGKGITAKRRGAANHTICRSPGQRVRLPRLPGPPPVIANVRWFFKSKLPHHRLSSESAAIFAGKRSIRVSDFRGPAFGAGAVLFIEVHTIAAASSILGYSLI